MHFTILNGEPDPGSAFDSYVAELTARLTALGHPAEKFDLRTIDLKGCSGCFNCWLKSPGECCKRDGSAIVCHAVLASGFVLLASPLIMGFTSALLKRAADQMIPIVHPYFEIQGGEVHHRARYAHYPLFGLLLAAGADSDAEDIAITTAIWRRTARNLKSRLAFTAVAGCAAKEVADELALVA